MSSSRVAITWWDDDGDGRSFPSASSRTEQNRSPGWVSDFAVAALLDTRRVGQKGSLLVGHPAIQRASGSDAGVACRFDFYFPAKIIIAGP